MADVYFLKNFRHMYKNIIIFIYTLIFWILIPVLVIAISYQLDYPLNLTESGFDLPVLPGVIILMFSIPLLCISIWQYSKFSGELPVSAFPSKIIIKRGLYNYWRHPIYLFYILVLIGIAFLLRSFTMLVIVIPVFIICTFVYILIEENLLTRRFGDAYKYYKKQTGLIFPVLYQCLRYPVLLVFKILFRFRSENRHNIPVSTPYFIIAEHKNYLDPFFIAYSIPHPVSYLTTFEVFRRPFLRWIMRLSFSIPRKRFLSDAVSVKLMLETLSKGGVIGLFPEGERSWTGGTQRFKPEVLKLLLKKSEIPIVPVKVHGSYCAWPRWADKLRRYKIRVEFFEPFYPDPGSSINDLEEKILNNFKSFSSEKISVRQDEIAKGIDKVFYRCSGCRSFNTFFTDKNRLTCKKCGFQLLVSDDLTISFPGKSSKTDLTVAEYYHSVKVTPEDPIFKLKSGSENPLINIHETTADIGESGECRLSAVKEGHFCHVLNGRLILKDEFIVFRSENEETSLSFLNISSVTTESNSKLQLFNCVTRQLYQVEFTRASVLQWQDIIVSAIKLKTGKDINTR
jgi:1-acyl-sn-glycerol-3-phosphate acyltransferase